jgi:hypothetical protein
MIGIAGFFISAFNSDTDPDAWLNVYWLWLGFHCFHLHFYFSLGLKSSRNSGGFSG